MIVTYLFQISDEPLHERLSASKKSHTPLPKSKHIDFEFDTNQEAIDYCLYCCDNLTFSEKKGNSDQDIHHFECRTTNCPAKLIISKQGKKSNVSGSLIHNHIVGFDESDIENQSSEENEEESDTEQLAENTTGEHTHGMFLEW